MQDKIFFETEQNLFRLKKREEKTYRIFEYLSVNNDSNAYNHVRQLILYVNEQRLFIKEKNEIKLTKKVKDYFMDIENSIYNVVCIKMAQLIQVELDKFNNKVENQLVNRKLEDQLLVIQALRKVYDRWQGQAYANVAADSYHFMNKSLFDSKLGFYKLSEKSTDLDKADIRLMSMTIETLKQLYPIVPLEDRDQLEFLTRIWSEKLQEFAAIVTKQ